MNQQSVRISDPQSSTNSKQPLRVVLYTRVSSKEQVDNMSLETQEAKAREHCAKNGWEIVAVFEEKGESAQTADRTKFKEMLDFCRKKSNRINVVLVYAVNRFARNSEDHVATAAKLRSWDIQLRSVTEPIDNSPTGRFMENVFASFAQLDNEMRKSSVLNGLQRALMVHDRWPFPVPLGYINSNNCITLDPDRAPLVKDGFVQFATGRYTVKQVLDDLTAQGLRTRTGRKVAPQTFHTMLRSQIYAGWLQVSKWGEKKKGNFEPIVDQLTFDQVLAILQGRRVTTAPFQRNHPDFPLRGYAKCGKCGAPMTGGWSKGRTKRYPYYQCSRHCNGMGIRAEELERKYLEVLDKARMKPNVVALFLDVLRDVWNENHAHAQTLAESCKQRVKKLEERRQRILNAFLDQQVIPKDTFQEQLSKVDTELAAARSEASDLTTNDLDIEATLDSVNRIVSNASQHWLALPLDQRQQLQRVLTGPEITVSADGLVGTVVTCPLFRLLEAEKVEKSNMVGLILASWNQILVWLRQIDQIRHDSAVELSLAA